MGAEFLQIGIETFTNLPTQGGGVGEDLELSAPAQAAEGDGIVAEGGGAGENLLKSGWEGELRLVE